MEPLLNPSSLHLSASQALGFRSTQLTVSKGFESHGADLDLWGTESWQALLFLATGPFRGGSFNDPVSGWGSCSSTTFPQ